MVQALVEVHCFSIVSGSNLLLKTNLFYLNPRNALNLACRSSKSGTSPPFPPVAGGVVLLSLLSGTLGTVGPESVPGGGGRKSSFSFVTGAVGISGIVGTSPPLKT